MSDYVLLKQKMSTNGQLPMNLSSIQLSELVDLQSRQDGSRMVEKFAETRAILN